MRADIKGCLANINKSYKVFEHDGKPMTKEQVKAVLEYALSQGYDHTGQLTNGEINTILSRVNRTINQSGNIK